jgi:hypothetical protein
VARDKPVLGAGQSGASAVASWVKSVAPLVKNPEGTSLNFNGSATLFYTVSDGHAAATGVVTISVGGVNDPPVAVDDFLVTDEDTPLTIDPFSCSETTATPTNTSRSSSPR